ncbi:MAG TPA: phosphorylase [Candidatus Dormibacteraeota bacterium]|nr:phosphorylase [Candidatus Dormibacteraeota bacterium]
MARDADGTAIPTAGFALLGGSRIAASGAPEHDPRVTRVAQDLVFMTPFGPTPPVDRLVLRSDEVAEERSILAARLHAAPQQRDRPQTVLALFWVLQRAEVRRIVAETGAGSITQHFHPRDLIVPHDFIDFTPQVNGQLDPDAVLVMREPFCPEIREVLWHRARRFAAEKATRVFNRAVYVAVQGPRFETAAEVAALARLGGDVIGQALAPEVGLAREIGACYGVVQMVLNYAEGVRPEWDFDLLREIVREGAEELGPVALDALSALAAEPGCSCASYRKRPQPAEAAVPDTA